MNITSIRDGDIVEVNKKGRFFYGRVTGRIEQASGRSNLEVDPITPGITYREATAHEVVSHFKRMGRR